MISKIETPNGIDIITPKSFYEYYNHKYDIMYFGEDNLYPQVLKNFLRNSPTLNKCVNRETEFLQGESNSNLISRQDFNSICRDYALFNGFSIYVHYNVEGEIDFLQHVPFESIRLKEKGQNGIFTRCSYCPDWSFSTTINKKRVSRTDIVNYFLYSDDIEVRKRRANSDGGSEILYYSEGTVYPVSNADPVLAYISCEIGIQNITYRNVRSNFLPASVISIPKTNDEDFSQFSNNLKLLQGDNNSLKILAFEYSSSADKPEVISLQSQNYDTAFSSTKDDCRNKIIGVFKQEAFIRLEEGSLGFGSETVGEIYKYYNFSLKSKRYNLLNMMRELDNTFTYKEIIYE